MKLEDYKIIYVACKYGGDKDRVLLCDSVIKELIKDDKKNGRSGIIYFSPLRAYGWLYEETDYDEGLNWTLRTLMNCDELYVMPDWETSQGVNQEIAISKMLGIPICYL